MKDSCIDAFINQSTVLTKLLVYSWVRLVSSFESSLISVMTSSGGRDCCCLEDVECCVTKVDAVVARERGIFRMRGGFTEGGFVCIGKGSE